MNHPKLIAAMLIPILFTSCLTLEVTEGEIDGTITGYSEAGDAITDIGYDVVIASGFSYGDMVSIASGEYTSSMPLCSSAGDVDAGSPAAVLDEEDGLSIMIRDGSFQESSGLEEGAELAMTISEEGGYLEEYSRRNLIRMEDRDYYESDEAYADFRAVIPGILYRSSSPIEGDARSLAADSLIGENGIMSIINLEDSQEELQGKAGAGVSYRQIADEGRAIGLGMDDGFFSAESKEKAAEAIRFIIANPGPYLIHDSDGLAETAWMAAYLEALAGVNINWIVKDYMRTFTASCGVVDGSEQYQEVSQRILDFFVEMNGRPFPWSMLQQAARIYAESQLGLSSEEIDAAVSILSGS